MNCNRLLVPAAVGLLFGFVSFASAADVTECGQVIPQGEVGVLQADLDCEATPGPKVCWSDLSPCETDDDCTLRECASHAGVYVGDRLGKGRTALEMNGHSIRMAGFIGGLGVACRSSRCTVAGPGTISNAYRGITVERSADIEGIEVYNSWKGIQNDGGGRRLNLTDVVVRDNVATGVAFAGKLKATNLTVLNNGTYGIAVSRIKAVGVVANGNMVGIGGNDRPLRGRITGLQAADNWSAGVEADRIKLIDSTLSSNGVLETAADLRTSKRPKLLNTACSRSEICERESKNGLACLSTGETWGVCN